MRLGVGISVCALALLPHSKADSSIVAYGSRNNLAARSEVEGSSSSSAAQSSESVPAKPITTWIAQPEFPKAIFASYYKEPSLVQQPQPIVHDEYYNYSFPSNLTDPAYIKQIVPNPVNFPYNYPLPENTDPTTAFYQSIDTAASIINGSAGVVGNCTRCVAVIAAGQVVARLAPGNFSDALIRLCKMVSFKPDADCERDYAKNKPEPAIWSQVLQAADVLGNDGQFICNAMFGQTWCDKPEAIKANLTFGVEKPANATAPPPNRKRVKVLHLSDVHLDPRYTVGAEAVNCPEGGCCRTDPNNGTTIKNPAPFNGHPNCDTPFSLLASALSSVSQFSAQDTIEWTLFSGDLMPRENAKYRNDKYLAFVQSAVYKVMKYFLPQGPVYPVLGALDAFNEEPSIQHPLIADMKESQINNYNHMRAIIDANKWLSKEESVAIGPHRMGYTTKHPKYPKLRIIALNTNFWSLQNYYTYVNTTSPRESMILSDLIDWLLVAEKAQERVWIVGHIPPFAAQSLPNHSEAFYQVVERFTPHVIAGVFFGHLHTDSVNIFYKDGGKDVTKESNVVITSWLAPSLSPKSGNPSYKIYEVDTGDFKIYESRTYFTNTSNLANTHANTTTNSDGRNGSSSGLLWELACDAREVYGKIINWPSASPINAAFWHRVGNAMLQSNTSDQTNLAARYHMFKSTSIDGKEVTGKCDATCINATVCRMRAAKESLWEKCGSDEVQKDTQASTASASTQTYTTSNGSLSITAATPTKRSVDSEMDLEIDIYIDYSNPGIDGGGTEESSAGMQKRWGSGFWSKASSMAGVAAGQKVQSQGQYNNSSTEGHVTETRTITGTSTKTMTVLSHNAGSSSIAKRDEEPTGDGIHSIADPVEARSAGPDTGKYDENILPAETSPMTGEFGAGGLSAAMTANQGITSTGYQLLDQVISAQSRKSGYSVVHQNSDTRDTARARGRDLTNAPEEPVETASLVIVGDSEIPSNSRDDAAGSGLSSEQFEGHGQEGQTLTDSAQFSEEKLRERAMVPADAPDTTTTAPSNEPTDGAPGGPSDQPLDFPIYRPNESMDGQIVRRRLSVGSDGDAVATSTQADFPTEGQAWPESTPTPFSSRDENFDPLELATDSDIVAKRDEKRQPGCDTYTFSSVCSSTVTYVEYTPEQSTQILSAYLSGASRYNALMATMARKTTSKWSTFTINFSPTATVQSKATVSTANGKNLGRREANTLGCVTNDDGVVCSDSPTFIDKRSAIPDPSAEPDPNKLIELWSKKNMISSRASTYTPWTTDTSHIEAATWIKRSAEPVAEPEPTAVADPDAINQLLSLWQSRLLTGTAKSAAPHTDPANLKRSAEPEPTAIPDPDPEAKNDIRTIWESRFKEEAAKSATVTKGTTAAKSNAGPSDGVSESTSCEGGFCQVYYSPQSVKSTGMADGVFM